MGLAVSITSSVAIVNDTTWSTIVGTWRPGRLELYVDGFSRASSTAAATSILRRREAPAPMAFGLSKLSCDRPRGVHPGLVRVIERAIQITTPDFRFRDACARVSGIADPFPRPY